MNFKAVFYNEMPFLIQLPDGDHEVNVKYQKRDTAGSMVEEVKLIKLNLSNNHYRVHTSPFGNKGLGTYIDGTKEELEKYIVSNKITNYAFEHLKTYITCTIEYDIELSEALYSQITDEQLKDRLTSIIVRNQDGIVFYKDGELAAIAEAEFNSLTAQDLQELKTNYLVHKFINGIGNDYVYLYHQALNIFISQYSYIRNDFFVEKLTMHTLEGTFCFQYVDGHFYERIKYAEKIPSVIGNKIWREDISETDLIELNHRLINGFEIPATKELLLTARNLYERGEFRSAVINSSAALEVAVENKIVEKMKANGVADQDIITYLDITKMDFPQRCDRQLRDKTGRSLVRDNATLWMEIKSHRKKFRHKIAHSFLVPEKVETDKAINDFEQAINWVEAL